MGVVYSHCSDAFWLLAEQCNGYPLKICPRITKTYSF